MSLHDTLERRLAETEAIFDAQPIASFGIDQFFRIMRLNHRALRYTGHDSYKSVIQQSCHRMIQNRSDVCPFCPLDNEWKTVFAENDEPDRPYRIIEKVIHKRINNTEKSFKITFILIRTNSIRIVEMIEDITEEREKQEEMLRIENLATMGTMISGIAHELNNPLTGISLTLQNLLANLSTMDSAEVTRRLKFIQKDLSKAARIVQDILSLARPGIREKHQVNLVRIIEKARDNTIRLYPVLSRKIRWEIPASDDYIMQADPDKLERLFFNLFRNAIQAYDYKEGLIAVHLKHFRNSVYITVIDDAGGIPPEILQKIFVPFYSGSRSGRGTGLGLPICLNIVREHGGRLKIKSKKGRTFFFISMPLRIQEQRP
jgi:signal transduction histidine kinase